MVRGRDRPLASSSRLPNTFINLAAWENLECYFGGWAFTLDLCHHPRQVWLSFASTVILLPPFREGCRLFERDPLHSAKCFAIGRTPFFEVKVRRFLFNIFEQNKKNCDSIFLHPFLYSVLIQ